MSRSGNEMMQILERVIEKSEFEGNYSEFYHSGCLFQPSPSLSNITLCLIYLYVFYIIYTYIYI